MTQVPALFEFSVERGFLPQEDPQSELWFGSETEPHVLDMNILAWESIAQNISHYLAVGAARKAIQELPCFPLKILVKEQRNYERAMQVFSALGHAYIFGGPQPETVIPQVLAEPWCAIADQLGTPPVLSYPFYSLYNWRRLDKQKPITLENLAVLQNFAGGTDEDWFILIHVEIEAKAGHGIAALYNALQAAKERRVYDASSSLEIAAQHLSKLHEILARMPEHCDPYIYYNRVRPYLQGWKDNPIFPDGVLYEGCFENRPQKFRGETGAQSSILPALDALLGIQHEKDRFFGYLMDMRNYMPPAHRLFLNHLESQADILRNFVIKFKSLHDYYIYCVESVFKFRSQHLRFSEEYIAKQTPKSNNPTSVGTGGTPFLKYLKKHQDDTLKAFKLE